MHLIYSLPLFFVAINRLLLLVCFHSSFSAFLNLCHFLKIKKTFIQQKGGPCPLGPTPKSAPAVDSELPSWAIKHKDMKTFKSAFMWTLGNVYAHYLTSLRLSNQFYLYDWVIPHFSINKRLAYTGVNIKNNNNNNNLS